MNWQALGTVIAGVLGVSSLLVTVLRWHTDGERSEEASAEQRGANWTAERSAYVSEIAAREQEQERLRSRVTALETKVEEQQRVIDRQAGQIQTLQAQLWLAQQKGTPP